MEMMQSQAPGVFVLILTKIFNYLAYLARIPIKNEDGDDDQLNLYVKALETLIEKNTGPDGEKPAWLVKVELVFHWGAKAAGIVDKIGQGQIPDVDMFLDALTLNMMSMNDFQEFVPPTSDNMLI